MSLTEEFNQFGNNPKTIEEYEERTNPKLKEYKRAIVDTERYEIINKKWYKFIKGLGIVFILVLVVFAYLAYDGKFKSELICPNVTLPNCPSCSCPNCNLTCAAITCPKVQNNCTCNFPKSINMNLTGGICP